VVTEADLEAMRAAYRADLDKEFEIGQAYKPNKADWLDGKWAGLSQAKVDDDPRKGKTGVDLDVLKDIGAKLTTPPDDFEAHRTIKRFLANRKAMIDSGEGIDWATGEALAFGSLAVEGHPIRLSGQDCERGTFSQRHSVLYDQRDEKRFIPLNNLKEGQARYESSTRCSPKKRCSGSNTATPWPSRTADPLGSAIRRLRQRRAGSVRPVPVLGRAQMAAHVRPRLPAAARL
jgi:2-oxoglutarate dehydrogenase E1 component